LGVVVADLVDEVEQMARLDRHDAAIAEADLALLGAGVAGLDDARECGVPVEHEASVGARIGRPEAGGGGRGGRLAAAGGEQYLRRLGAPPYPLAQQRHATRAYALSQPRLAGR